MLNLVPIVAPEGEAGLFHSDNIFEAMAISEVYGYVVFFVVAVVFFIVAAIFAKFYLLYRDSGLQNKVVMCYHKLKRMF